MSGTETETATMGDDDGWGDALAEAGEAPPPPPPSPPRVLNQAEIDSLLGFDDGPGGGETRTGIQQIISSGLVSYERLPMLEIVFDRLVRIMSTSLAQLHLATTSRSASTTSSRCASATT
jgi:flagellar motor switch protein FliM